MSCVMEAKHKLIPLLLAILVVLAGCGSMGSDGGDGGGAVGEGGDGAQSAAPDSGDGGGGVGGGDQGAAESGQQSDVSSRQLQVDRSIIREGTLELRVEDFESARSQIADHARNLNGYVSGSGSSLQSRDNQSWKRGHVVVRVPSERYAEMLSFGQERGTVLSEDTSTTDVTDQLVDLDARLTNLKDRRSRLRSFYDQANTTEELIRIEEQLSEVQREIEQLEAEKRSLEDRVALATLRVELREPRPDPVSEDEDTTGASLVSAFQQSATTALDVGYGVLIVGVSLTPYLLIFGIPALLIGAVARHRYGVTLPWVGRRTDTRARESERPLTTETGSQERDASSADTDNREGAGDDESATGE
jgi:hypothetical protein